jgi:AhpD family alkylhydroperoxidase
MAQIKLPEGIPGILGPMAFSPETARPLNELAEILLRGPNTRAPADREMIATYVSSQNDCYFCQHAHGAVTAYHLGGNEKLVNDVTSNFESAAISDKLKALLAIAARCKRLASKSLPNTLNEHDGAAPPTRKFTTPC